MVKKRWLSLFVENEVGVLARVSGLFSGKSYNLDSLTVGVTEDVTLSRMTISLTSDDQTFEQVKKQLNRCVEVVKVIDLTDTPIHMKELMFVKVHTCSEQDMTRLNYIREIFNAKLIDYDAEAALLECVQPEQKNNDLIRLLENHYPNRLEIVRGGSVAMEAVSISDNTV
ncbi:acetolactate synthase small subunit [Butyricicoccus sp.]|uniref:acetolactate synthase small subunit n=1 Tax=Butyricicoccus sp. TaxID=2049021 RepID=UPI003F13B778